MQRQRIWFTAIVAISSLVFTLGSTRVWCRWVHDSGWYAYSWGGRFYIGYARGSFPLGWTGGWAPPQQISMVISGYLTADSWGIAIPFWVPAVFVIVAVFLKRWITRAKYPICDACGYDLRGLPMAAGKRCPECGASQRREV